MARLDRALQLALIEDGVMTLAHTVWGRRLSRDSEGDRLDQVTYELRWSATWYGHIVKADVHDLTINLADGDRTFRILSAEESGGRNRYMMVSGQEVE